MTEIEADGFYVRLLEELEEWQKRYVQHAAFQNTDTQDAKKMAQLRVMDRICELLIATEDH